MTNIQSIRTNKMKSNTGTKIANLENYIASGTTKLDQVSDWSSISIYNLNV